MQTSDMRLSQLLKEALPVHKIGFLLLQSPWEGVIMAVRLYVALGSDMSARVVVANKIHHCSYATRPFTAALQDVLVSDWAFTAAILESDVPLDS